MNERIRLLADEARKHFPKTEMSGEFWVFDEGKFAELIVTECAGQLIKWKDEPFPYDPEFGARLIKQHFRVEQ